MKLQKVKKALTHKTIRIVTDARPLRAETMQGPRVALAHSETVPEGSACTFTIQLLDGTLEKAVRECLDYGELRGLAQWRNSGKGRFTWTEAGEKKKTKSLGKV